MRLALTEEGSGSQFGVRMIGAHSERHYDWALGTGKPQSAATTVVVTITTSRLSRSRRDKVMETSHQRGVCEPTPTNMRSWSSSATSSRSFQLSARIITFRSVRPRTSQQQHAQPANALTEHGR